MINLLELLLHRMNAQHAATVQQHQRCHNMGYLDVKGWATGITSDNEAEVEWETTATYDHAAVAETEASGTPQVQGIISRKIQLRCNEGEGPTDERHSERGLLTALQDDLNNPWGHRLIHAIENLLHPGHARRIMEVVRAGTYH